MSKAKDELNQLFDGQKDWQIVKRSNFEVITECTACIDLRDFKATIEKISQYLQEETVLDIQLVCIYLQAHFNINHTADDLVSVLDILSNVLSKYELISPVNKKEAILLRSVILLINELNDAVNYYYPDFLEAQITNVRSCLDRVQEQLLLKYQEVDLIEFNKAKNNLLTHTNKYIRNEDKYEDVEQTPDVEGECQNELILGSQVKNLGDNYSHLWLNLLSKIDRFNVLVNSESESRTLEIALLFDYIQTEIENFNPIKYFSNSFEKFLSPITPELYTEIQQVLESTKGSPLWDFMLRKAEADIEIYPTDKQSRVTKFDISNIKKNSVEIKENHQMYKDYHHNEDQFDDAFDDLD